MLFLTLGFMSISSVTLVSAAKCGTQKLDSVDVVDQSHYSNLKDIICDPAASWCAGSPACSWPVIVDSSHQLTLSREGQATQDECLRGFVSPPIRDLLLHQRNIMEGFVLTR